MFKFKVSRKTVITSTTALTGIIVTAAVLVLAQTVQKNDGQSTQVKGIATSAKTTKQAADASKSSDGQYVKTTTQTVTVNTPKPQAAKTASTPTNGNNTQNSQPSGSSTTDQTPAPSNPANQPSFSITLRAADTIFVTYPFEPVVKQAIVPFDITYDEGFVKTNYQQPGCIFTSAPVANHGVICNVNEKDADTHSLSIQYSDNSPSGYYSVLMSYSINGVTRTDTFEFNL